MLYIKIIYQSHMLCTLPTLHSFSFSFFDILTFFYDEGARVILMILVDFDIY